MLSLVADAMRSYQSHSVALLTEIINIFIGVSVLILCRFRRRTAAVNSRQSTLATTLMVYRKEGHASLLFLSIDEIALEFIEKGQIMRSPNWIVLVLDRTCVGRGDFELHEG
jgi:hypothetical protein